MGFVRRGDPLWSPKPQTPHYSVRRYILGEKYDDGFHSLPL